MNELPHVTSLEEAETWFLDHSTGSILCRRTDGAELEADSYPAARAFFLAGLAKGNKELI